MVDMRNAVCPRGKMISFRSKPVSYVVCRRVVNWETNWYLVLIGLLNKQHQDQCHFKTEFRKNHIEKKNCNLRSRNCKHKFWKRHLNWPDQAKAPEAERLAVWLKLDSGLADFTSISWSVIFGAGVPHGSQLVIVSVWIYLELPSPAL